MEASNQWLFNKKSEAPDNCPELYKKF
jgi:hypothetical protein